MSWAILKATLRQRRWGVLWYSVGLVTYSWLMVWLWPQLGREGYAELLEQMPPELLAVFGTAAGDMGTLGGYFENEYLGVMWMIIVSSAVITYAVKAVASEVASGTMELTLTQPVSRLDLIVARIVGLFVVSAVLVVATFLPIQLLGPHYEIDLNARTYALLYGNAMLLVLSVGSLALALSAGARDGGRPAAIAAGTIGAMWVVGLLAGVSDLARRLEPVNLITYWQPAGIINRESVPPDTWWVLSAFTLMALFISIIRFMRRDVA